MMVKHSRIKVLVILAVIWLLLVDSSEMLLFASAKVSTTWTMLRIMFSDPANQCAPALNHNHSKLGGLPLMNR